MKKLKSLNVKKAVGCDGIPAKLIKMAAPSLAKSLTHLINKSISTSLFPDGLKLADIKPTYKCKDTLSKENYRPISVLPILSKIFESLLDDQLEEFIDNILSIYLSAFPKNYSCQSVLIKMIEDWKMALDKPQTTGAIFIDLSKAFDTFSHSLLLDKLKNYVLSDSAIKIMSSYLSKCFQRVKIGENVSKWGRVQCGVPQGSLRASCIS